MQAGPDDTAQGLPMPAESPRAATRATVEPAAESAYEFPDAPSRPVSRPTGPRLVTGRRQQSPACLLRYRYAKRLIDLVLVLLATPVLLPALLIVGALVRFTSPGPEFFSHRRISLHGDFFSMWKFRTMCVDSAERLDHYLARHPEARAEWNTTHKLRDDPRVTSVGLFLRRYSLDELPQVWNVVTGRSDNYTGRVPFTRLGTTVAHESMLSCDFLVLTAAYERDVADIASEPMRLEVPNNGSAFLWIPDYRIDRLDERRELVEVKPVELVHPDRARHQKLTDAELEWAIEEADARFDAIRRAAEREGYVFRLLTEDEIRVEPRLGNAAYMLRYDDDFFPEAWLLRGREALVSLDARCVADLQSAIPDLDALVVSLRLAWLGEIEIDPALPYSRTSTFVRVGSRRFQSES